MPDGHGAIMRKFLGYIVEMIRFMRLPAETRKQLINERETVRTPVQIRYNTVTGSKPEPRGDWIERRNDSGLMVLEWSVAG